MIYTDVDAAGRVVAHQRCSLRFGGFSRSKVGTRRTEGTEVAQDFMQDTKQAAVSSKWLLSSVNRLKGVTREWCRSASEQFGCPYMDQNSLAQNLSTSLQCRACHATKETEDTRLCSPIQDRVEHGHSEKRQSSEEVFRTTPASGTS